MGCVHLSPAVDIFTLLTARPSLPSQELECLLVEMSHLMGEAIFDNFQLVENIIGG